MKYTIGEICETLDILHGFEIRFRDREEAATVSIDDCETLAALLYDYQKLLLGIKVDV